jgi:hypothetical protein
MEKNNQVDKTSFTSPQDGIPAERQQRKKKEGFQTRRTTTQVNQFFPPETRGLY